MRKGESEGQRSDPAEERRRRLACNAPFNSLVFVFRENETEEATSVYVLHE